MTLSGYKEIFLEELEDQLGLMDEGILALEQSGTSDTVIQNLFRAAHTLKGSSAAMGFESMKELTHEMEHLLDKVRSKQMDVQSPLINLLFKSLDQLKQLKEEIVHHDQTISEISALIAELQTYTNSAATPSDVFAGAGWKPGLSLDAKLKIEEARERGCHLWWVSVRISAECVIKGARAYVVQNHLNERGEVLLSYPELDSVEESFDSELEISFVFAGHENTDEIKESTASLIDVVSVAVEPFEADMSMSDPPALEAGMTATVAGVDGQAEPSGADKARTPTIRVSVERLEHLMNLVGELVIDQTRINQVERNLSRQFVGSESVEELAQISDHITRVIGDLQESVMKTRMLPIEQLFNRFPRMVRDLALKLGKDVDFVMEGKDTELDRTLIEEIADPLIHLIRNALDHGIESPEARIAKGKPAKGVMRIRAAYEDNQVVIYVEDDGAGIDASKIKSSAVGKGVISKAEAELLTEKEAIHLIFHAGFSTAASVSDVSGRGVGMDIVKSHIEKLNGLIDIETEVGVGTRFKIRLPLTLAIITGLLVKLSHRTFIIPMSNIAEIVRATQEDIRTVRGQSVIVIRNQVTPILWLHDQFQIERPRNRRNQQPLVIVGTAEKRVALAVDELLGNQEVVIKSLGSYIGKVDSISGATILGDGRVALILEISAIINRLSGR